MMSVEMSAKQRYRIILFGSLYAANREGDTDDFRRSIGRLEEYEPDVSREETTEDS